MLPTQKLESGNESTCLLAGDTGSWGSSQGSEKVSQKLKRDKLISEMSSEFYSLQIYPLDTVFFTSVLFPVAAWVLSQPINASRDNSMGTVAASGACALFAMSYYFRECLCPTAASLNFPGRRFFPCGLWNFY